MDTNRIKKFEWNNIYKTDLSNFENIHSTTDFHKNIQVFNIYKILNQLCTSNWEFLVIFESE